MRTLKYMKGGFAASICGGSVMMRPVSSGHDDSHHPILGVGLKLISVVCLAVMAACVKALGPEVPPGQVVFFRGIIAMLVIGVVAWRGAGLRTFCVDVGFVG